MRSFSPGVIRLALLALLAVLLTLALLFTQKPSSSKTARQFIEPQLVPQPQAADVPPRADTIAAAAVKPAADTGKASEQKTNVAHKSSWQIGNNASATPQIPLNSVIAEYEVVEVEQRPHSLPQVGEAIELAMLKGKKILVKVESLQTNPNGDRTWTGHMEGYGSDYPVVMTYGEQTVFATITTPEGSYTLEAKEGSGWLYKNPSEFELSDAGAKDYLEIPDAHKL